MNEISSVICGRMEGERKESDKQMRDTGKEMNECENEGI